MKHLNRDELKPIWDTLHLPYIYVSRHPPFLLSSFPAGSIISTLITYLMAIRMLTMIHTQFPVAGNVIRDLNTGQSYLKTHCSVCKNPNDMVLAWCPLAIDKTKREFTSGTRYNAVWDGAI
jgi:hypothetical protein